MSSSRWALCLIFLLLADSIFAAGFGDIPASLALPAGQSVRRNAGNTAFEAFTPASLTGAALTKTDDTNVTLTLGGTPATALLAATSITAGWTGTLAVARGGTGSSSAGTALTALGAQPADADLTTWAGITPGANVGTFLATPSSANLRGALTDENGTGALLFSGATTPDFTTGFTIGAAAATGKIPIGNGTSYIPSTPTWPTAAGTAGYNPRSDGTNIAMYPSQMSNAAVSDQTGFAADQYLVGSNVTVAAGDFKAKGQYRCVFGMAKTGSTATPTIDVRIGTAGAIGDTSRMQFVFGNGTGVADTGIFEVIITFRTVGSGTSAVIGGICRSQHNLATTGLYNNAASWTIVGTTSSGFDSSTATNIGLSFNGGNTGSTFGGTSKNCQAVLEQ